MLEVKNTRKILGSDSERGGGGGTKGALIINESIISR